MKPMFLSLVRPERISSPITSTAAVTISESTVMASIGLDRYRPTLKPAGGIGSSPSRRYNPAAPGAGKRPYPMTYCCGILVREGLVMIADTRTNAGLDNVSTFRKLHIFSDPGERILAVASAGNLAISQSVLSTLTGGFENPETGGIETLMNAPTMFQAAQRI